MHKLGPQKAYQRAMQRPGTAWPCSGSLLGQSRPVLQGPFSVGKHPDETMLRQFPAGIWIRYLYESAAQAPIQFQGPRNGQWQKRCLPKKRARETPRSISQQWKCIVLLITIASLCLGHPVLTLLGHAWTQLPKDAWERTHLSG